MPKEPMKITVDQYRKVQISQWDFAPEGAFRCFRNVDTGLSKACCEFIFYRRSDNALVTDDSDQELKDQLAFLEPQIQW